jgi:hypothetical protein
MNKKRSLLILFGCFFWASGSYASPEFITEKSENTVVATTILKGGKRKKSGRFKRKKGLFGKKNECGCS